MNLQDMLFGPLGKDYCLIFLFFSFLALVTLVLTVLGGIALLFSKKGKPEFYIGIAYGIIMSALNYLVLRLLYNMCKR
jgi:hypothetical protein